MENKGAVAIVLVIITVGIGIAGFTLINMPPADNTTTTDTTTDTSTTTTTDPGYTGPPIILRYTDLLDLNIVVPDWEFPMVGGSTFKVADHRGEVIFIDFMATWCGYCEKQNDEIELLWATHSDQMNIISVTATQTDTLDKLETYMDDRSIEWPHGRDENGVASDFVGVPGIPSMIMIDGDGLLRYFHIGWPFLYEDVDNDPEVHSILEVLEWITG